MVDSRPGREKGHGPNHEGLIRTQLLVVGIALDGVAVHGSIPHQVLLDKTLACPRGEAVTGTVAIRSITSGGEPEPGGFQTSELVFYWWAARVSIPAPWD